VIPSGGPPWDSWPPDYGLGQVASDAKREEWPWWAKVLGIVGAVAIGGLIWRMSLAAKVFISFDWDNDRHYRHLLSALNENPRSDITFVDSTPSEIQTNDVGRIKAALMARIRDATHTLVLLGEHANTQHRDSAKIGARNWQWWEIEQSKAERKKLIAVKLDSDSPTPQPLLNSEARVRESRIVWNMAADRERPGWAPPDSRWILAEGVAATTHGVPSHGVRLARVALEGMVADFKPLPMHREHGAERVGTVLKAWLNDREDGETEVRVEFEAWAPPGVDPAQWLPRALSVAVMENEWETPQTVIVIGADSVTFDTDALTEIRQLVSSDHPEISVERYHQFAAAASTTHRYRSNDRGTATTVWCRR
jgi:hypothetical protein